jgi:hypothetical protein
MPQKGGANRATKPCVERGARFKIPSQRSRSGRASKAAHRHALRIAHHRRAPATRGYRLRALARLSRLASGEAARSHRRRQVSTLTVSSAGSSRQTNQRNAASACGPHRPRPPVPRVGARPPAADRASLLGRQPVGPPGGPAGDVISLGTLAPLTKDGLWTVP